MMKMFLAQLKAIGKMVDDNATNDGDMSKYDLDFDAILIPIIQRKILEHSRSTGVETALNLSSEEESLLFDFVDKIIEKHALFEKIYSSITVVDDKDNEDSIRFESNMPGLIYYFRSEIEGALNSYNSIFETRELALRSSIIYLCICLETLAFEMLKNYYLNNSGDKQLEKKELTFSSLRSFESIEDARIYLIEKELDALFRNDFDSWFKEVDNVFKITNQFPQASDLISSLSELFLRRNLYVHANGIVNDIYIKKSQLAVEKGTTLKPDTEYIKTQIKNINTIGWYMFYKYSCYVHKGFTDQFFCEMNNLLLAHMSSNCDAIPEIFGKLENENALSVQNQMYSKMNRFLYYRVNNRIEEIANELENFDVSAYSLEYCMAKAIILDSDDAYDKAKNFLEGLEESNFFMCLGWPLIGLIKNREPFQSMIDNIMNKFIFSEEEETLVDLNNTADEETSLEAQPSSLVI